MHLLQRHKKLVSGLLLFSVIFLVALLPTISAVPYAYGDEVETLTKKDPALHIPGEENALDFGCYGKEGLGSNWIAGCSALVAYWAFLYPAFKIAGFASVLFNIAFVKLVVGMGATLKSMHGIDAAWTTLRDVGNIFLVFLLVYVGISTILGLSGYGYRRVLWRILLAALLVNFSITFTKIIIDVSNIAAIEMFETFITDIRDPVLNPTDGGYHSFTVAECTSAGTVVGDMSKLKDNPCVANGLAGAFWTKLGATSIFNVENKPGESSSGAYWGMFWSAIMGGIMFFILTFVFGATAFFLLARFVILIVLIIVSPVALIAAITGAGGAGSKWFHTLLNQSFFAPLILLMWWIAYRVMGSISYTGSSGSGDVSDPESISIMMTFIIVSGFLIAGLILAKKFGAYGSTTVINTGKKWSRAAVYGTVGAAAAQTAGRWSYNAAQRQRELAAKRFEKDAEGNYVDNTGAARFARTAAGKKLNRGMQNIAAAGSKKGFLKTKSFEERKKGATEAAKEQGRTYEKINRKEEINTAIKSGDSDVLRKATINELRENADDIRKNPSVVKHIPNATYKKLKENKDNLFTDSELRKFDEERAAHLANMDSEQIAETINKTTPKELVEHDAAFLGKEDFVKNLDTQTVIGMQKSGLSREKREAMQKRVEELYEKYTNPEMEDPNLSEKELKNIEKLHDWFNDDNKLSV